MITAKWSTASCGSCVPVRRGVICRNYFDVADILAGVENGCAEHCRTDPPIAISA